MTKIKPKHKLLINKGLEVCAVGEIIPKNEINFQIMEIFFNRVSLKYLE